MKLKHSLTLIRILFAGFFACTTPALAQEAPELNTITIPFSSTANPGDTGVRVHTNIQILGSGGMRGALQTGGPPFPGSFYGTPASIACIYELQPPTAGCDPNIVSFNPAGGGGAIAVVDAYDDPNAYSDLQNFSAQFGLVPITPSSFMVVYAPSVYQAPPSRPRPGPRAFGEAGGEPCSGPATQPTSAVSTGWDIEESLDVEWAHAMAPLATLYLVEAQSDSLSDLSCAVSVANSLVTQAGGGEVAMSWGSGEFPSENLADSQFAAPKVVYFAAAGDGPGVLYPSASPNVVAVGGTSLSFNCITGRFDLETTWQGTGGGASAYELRPSYQNGIASIVGTQRGTPDVALVANPYTGIWVLDSLGSGPGTWYIVGGTSVATIIMAGIVNAAQNLFQSTSDELTELYTKRFEFRDITYGNCGPSMGTFAAPGWDFCSGLGSPKGYSAK